MGGAQRAGTQSSSCGFSARSRRCGQGACVALGGQKPRALLAVLALEPGRVVSVDRLVEASGRATRPRRPRTPSRSTSPSFARRSAPRRS